MPLLKPRRIVFLDLDGVLNNLEWLRERRRPEGIDTFDPRNATALRWLVERCAPEIVISSTWRTIYSMADLRGRLRQFAIAPVIGKTPDLSYKKTRTLTEMNRSDEIAAYMATKRLELDQIVILDDDPLHALLAVRQIQTSFTLGLTIDDAKRAVDLWETNA